MQYYYYDPNFKEPPQNPFHQIGGGLVLFAIMVLIHPIYYTFHWLTDFYPMTTRGVLDTFADPKHPIFNLTLKNLLLTQVVYHALIVPFCGWLVYLFFAKKASFPWAFVGVHLGYLLVDVYYGIKVSAFLPYAHFWNREQAWWTVLQVAVILGGGGYLFWGDRCRRTFWR
jgi:hypothetical protein